MAKKPTKTTGTFAAGVGNPFRSDSDGGIAISEGEPYIEELVLVALQANESDNPFQDLGVTQFAAFQNAADPAWKLVMRRRIISQFTILDRFNLARFVRVDFSSGATGETIANVVYLNLETQKENTFTAGISPFGDVGARPI